MKRFFVYLSLLAYLVIVVYPMFWLLQTSLKESRELFTGGSPWALPARLHWVNFSNAWTDGRFGDYFANSIIITLGAMALIMACGTMASYVLGYLHHPFNRFLKPYFLGGLLVPVQLAVIPLFFLLLKLGLMNTHLGLILVYAAVSLPFTIFVLTGFFSGLPHELHDSAEIDGCSEWQVFTKVMLPLSRPGLITVAIFNFVGVWNEYLYALIFVSDERIKTLPLGLANLAMVKQYDTDFGALFAGTVIVLLPTLLVYMLLQRHLIKGLTAGAVKG